MIVVGEKSRALHTPARIMLCKECVSAGVDICRSRQRADEKVCEHLFGAVIRMCRRSFLPTPVLPWWCCCDPTGGLDRVTGGARCRSIDKEEGSRRKAPGLPRCLQHAQRQPGQTSSVQPRPVHRGR